tara:strand:- start:591 stop:815 length:225 start_codon:yes stop_codon:yes gene_type:complete
MKTELNAAIEKTAHVSGVADTDIKPFCDALVTGTFPSGQVLRQVLTDLGYHRKFIVVAGSPTVYMWDVKVIPVV